MMLLINAAPRNLCFLGLFLVATPGYSETESAVHRVEMLCEFHWEDWSAPSYQYIRIIFDVEDPKYLVLSDENGEFSILSHGYLSGDFGQGPNREARAFTGTALISQGSEGYLRVILIQADRPRFVINIKPDEARIMGLGPMDGMGEGACKEDS